MAMPAPQRVRQDLCYSTPGYLSPLPEHALFHTSRVIKYVFLDGSQNIIPAHVPSSFETHASYPESANASYHSTATPDWGMASSHWPPHLQRLPIFVTLSKRQEEQVVAHVDSPFSWERLPVFRQLCGEVVEAAVHGNEGDGCLRDLDGEPNKPSDIKALGMGEGRLGGEDCSPSAPSH